MADAAAKLGPSWGVIPVGGIIWLALDTIPDGFLLCNGAAVSRSAYSRLFAAIGTKWGAGNGSTTFALPDMRGRVPWGAANTGSYISAGLPNVLGGFDTFSTSSEVFGNAWGPFTLSEAAPRHVETSTTWNNVTHGVKMDLSTYNSIYGASSTVQPPALTLLPCIKY